MAAAAADAAPSALPPFGVAGPWSARDARNVAGCGARGGTGAAVRWAPTRRRLLRRNEATEGAKEKGPEAAPKNPFPTLRSPNEPWPSVRRRRRAPNGALSASYPVACVGSAFAPLPAEGDEATLDATAFYSTRDAASNANHASEVAAVSLSDALHLSGVDQRPAITRWRFVGDDEQRDAARRHLDRTESAVRRAVRRQCIQLIRAQHTVVSHLDALERLAGRTPFSHSMNGDALPVRALANAAALWRVHTHRNVEALARELLLLGDGDGAVHYRNAAVGRAMRPTPGAAALWKRSTALARIDGEKVARHVDSVIPQVLREATDHACTTADVRRGRALPLQAEDKAISNNPLARASRFVDRNVVKPVVSFTCDLVDGADAADPSVPARRAEERVQASLASITKGCSRVDDARRALRRRVAAASTFKERTKRARDVLRLDDGDGDGDGETDGPPAPGFVVPGCEVKLAMTWTRSGGGASDGGNDDIAAALAFASAGVPTASDGKRAPPPADLLAQAHAIIANPHLNRYFVPVFTDINTLEAAWQFFRTNIKARLSRERQAERRAVATRVVYAVTKVLYGMAQMPPPPPPGTPEAMRYWGWFDDDDDDDAGSEGAGGRPLPKSAARGGLGRPTFGGIDDSGGLDDGWNDGDGADFGGSDDDDGADGTSQDVGDFEQDDGMSGLDDPAEMKAFLEELQSAEGPSIADEDFISEMMNTIGTSRRRPPGPSPVVAFSDPADLVMAQAARLACCGIALAADGVLGICQVVDSALCVLPFVGAPMSPMVHVVPLRETHDGGERNGGDVDVNAAERLMAMASNYAGGESSSKPETRAAKPTGVMIVVEDAKESEQESAPGKEKAPPASWLVSIHPALSLSVDLMSGTTFCDEHDPTTMPHKPRDPGAILAPAYYPWEKGSPSTSGVLFVGDVGFVDGEDKEEDKEEKSEESPAQPTPPPPPPTSSPTL